MKHTVAMTILLMVLAACWLAGQDYQPPPQETVVAIDWFPEPSADVRSVMEIEAGDTFDAEALRNSIINLYRLGLYSDIHVTWSREEGGISLRFQFEEIPQIEGVTILGNGPVSKEQIIDTTRLLEDGRFTTDRERDIVDSVLKLYRQAGYYTARVSVFNYTNLENNDVRLEISINPGEPTLLRDIVLKGNPELNLSAIVTGVPEIEPGKRFQEEVFRSHISDIEAFYRKKNYRSAIIRLDAVTLDRQANAIDVELVISAGPLFFVNITPENARNQQLFEEVPLNDPNADVENLLNSGRRRMLSQLKNSGYVNADVQISYDTVIEEDTVGLQVNVSLDRGQAYTVGNLTINGIPEDLLPDLLPRLFLTKKGLFSRPSFSMEKLNEDARRIETYLKEKGYSQVSVGHNEPDLSGNDEEVDLQLIVDPGPRDYIGSITFKGNQALEDEELLKSLDAAEGDTYSREIAARLVEALNNAYDQRGYWQALISLEVHGQGAARDLVFNVSEGNKATVRKIIVAGNDITSRDVIINALEIEEGDPYSQQKIVESQSNLYRLGTFERVLIESLNEQLAGTERRLNVRVVERNPYAVLFGFGYDTEETIRFSFGVSNENIGGRTIRAGFSTRVSDLQQRYQISIGLPRLWDVFNESTMRLFYEEISRDGYDARKKGIVFETSGYNWRNWQIIGRYQYRWIDIFNQQGGIEIDRFEQPVRLHSFSTIFSNDARNDPFEPSAGSFSSAILQLAPDVPGSETAFARAEAQHSRYFDLFNGIVLAGSARLGAIRPFGDNTVPISERFFLGGSTSIRAFSLDRVGPSYTGADGRDYPLGGNAFANGSLELRFPLFVEISGATFYDTGQVFREIGDFSFSEFEHVLGVGLRLATPLGPLRFDYGVSLLSEDDQLYVTFGHAF